MPGEDQPPQGERSPLDTWVSVEGALDQGPDWDLAFGSDTLFVGVPADINVHALGLTETGAFAPSDASGLLTGEASDDRFGAALARVPDLDGDGVDELLIGAPGRDRADTTRQDGAAYLVSGFGQGFTGAHAVADIATFRVTGEDAGGVLGEVVAGCGDMDGDGGGEFVVAAPLDNSGGTLAGSIVMVRSSELSGLDSQVLAPSLPMRWLGSGVGERAGSAMSCSHDVTGDGVADLLVGAPFADGVHEAAGAIYIISGGESLTVGLLQFAADTQLEGLTSDAWLGWSIATGDLNSDGLTDIVGGAPGSDDARGSVYVWDGADLASGTTFPRFRLHGIDAGDGFGRSVAVGDQDGDGIDDLFIGAPRRNPDPGNASTFDAGALYIFRGAPDFSGWRPNRSADSAALTYEEQQQYLRTGQLIRVGDYDSDGLADVALLHRYAPE